MYLIEIFSAKAFEYKLRFFTNNYWKNRCNLKMTRVSEGNKF